MAGPSSPEGGGIPGLIQLLPIVLIFLIFYWVVLRPESKRRRVHDEMIANLTRGDRIITTGGLHGTIVGTEESVVHVRIADKVRVTVNRSAIAGFQPGARTEPTEEDK
ncbi:MAG: preprotein translocase subunit YajC [Candidatus Schekmanbacteria bacterium]|nr:preprotein translocase subunit YajC [Candidatus Schekmanbacteria bacterium]